MSQPGSPPVGEGPGPFASESAARIAGRQLVLLAAASALIWSAWSSNRPGRKAVPALAAEGALAPKPPTVLAAPPPQEPAPAPVPAPPAEIRPDGEAVARAEADLAAATRDRRRAAARVAEAGADVAEESARATADARSVKTLATRVRDPGARIARAAAKGGYLRAERDRLKAEVAALADAPKPKGKPLFNKSPVARVADREEFHFEVRRGRIAYIDLKKLQDLIVSDVRLRIRMAGSLRKPINATVGPVGAFAIRYEMGISMPDSVEGLMESRSPKIGLRGWEIVPQHEGRGETYESTRHPASAYARAINRLDPANASITIWVYPDGFPLYRVLRDELQARGFLVAARPMPEDEPIRGSPGGSVSAGQ